MRIIKNKKGKHYALATVAVVGLVGVRWLHGAESIWGVSVEYRVHRPLTGNQLDRQVFDRLVGGGFLRFR